MLTVYYTFSPFPNTINALKRIIPRFTMSRFKSTIIDVRTFEEYQKDALPGSINIPANDFLITDYQPYLDNQISLICETGRRAAYVRDMLFKHGYTNVTILDRQMSDIRDNSKPESDWNIDRQFRLVLAILIGTFLASYLLNNSTFISIPIIIFLGLTLSVVTDNCYMKIAIAKMPWNKPT